MIEADALRQALHDALMLFPVALYFGMCCAVAMTCKTCKEWLLCFVPDGIETVGDALLWFLLLLVHLYLTPGALVYYFVRKILRINISHIRKDNENENCNSGRRTHSL